MREELEKLECKKMLVTERVKNTEKWLSTVKDELKKSRQKLESTTKDRNEAEQKNAKEYKSKRKFNKNPGDQSRIPGHS